jgi:prepilin-type N-terminal cleavage/methylation domain-containing protein
MSIFSHNLRSFGKFRRKAGKPARGFTLVELLAVTVIITVITLVLLLRQSAFDSSTILRSLAYSVALSVRQAQVYGVSVLGQSGGSVQYAPAYGLYFSRTTPSSYVLFADYNNDQVYDPTSETVKVFSLSPGYLISEVCVKRGTGGNNRCTGIEDTTGVRTINYITILFKRPNPDAVFGSTKTTETYISAWIQVKSPGGTTRSVLVTGPGQITVQPPGTLP